MCGITGLVEFQPFPELSDLIGRMTDSLAHRGPDGRGIHTAQDGSRQVGLGHTRLRVIDLSEAASQPMLNDDGSVRLVFNGEIYNYRDLRRSLQERGVSFRTASDTEVVLRLYEAEGEKAFERLEGMFALGLWDDRKKTLLLVRDPLGKKPLFYFHGRERFAFASEIKALLKHPQIRRVAGIRESALPAFFFFGYVPSPETLYTGILKLPPGHLLQLEASGACRLRPFWELPLPDRDGGAEPILEEAASQRLKELLRNAVERRLVADVPLGAFLSGGLDSSIVVGLMSQLVREPVRTFSIGFSGDRHFDETPYARSAARRFGTRHEEFIVGPSSLDLVEKLVRHHDGPFADSSAIPVYLLSELTRRHVTVALTGDGGDELFAGYLRFPAALWLERLPAWSRVLFHRSFSRLPPFGGRRGPLRRLQKMASAAHLPLLQRYSAWVSVCGEDLGDLLQPEGLGCSDPLRLLDPVLKDSQGRSALTRLLDMNLKSYLPEDLLVKTDRCTMAHGLEARCPFLDRELVEFAFTLPDRLKLRGGHTKFILRRAFRDFLPTEISRRGKMGFGVPLERWFRGDFQSHLQARLLEPGAALHRYVQRPALARILDEHQRRRADHSPLLWTLLTFQVWLEQLPSWG